MSNLGLGLGTSTVDAADRLRAIACGSKCPVSGGHPMRVTRRAWAKLCASKRKSGVEYGISHYGKQRFHKTFTRCRTCKGKDIPPEVHFIDAAEVASIEKAINHRNNPKNTDHEEPIMALKKHIGICDICETKANIFRNHEVEMCSTCANMVAHIKNRMSSVVKSARILGQAEAMLDSLATEMGQPWLMKAISRHLPEQVTVDLTQGPLAAIAELVGYTGSDSEGLVTMIEQMVSENHRAIGILSPADDINANLKEALLASQSTLATICRHLGINQETDLPTYQAIASAVAHSEATLEWIARETNQLVGLRLQPQDVADYIHHAHSVKNDHARFMVGLRDVLGLPVCSVQELLNTVQGKCSLLEEYSATMDRTVDNMTLALRKQDEAEQQLLADEQIFAKIREILSDDSLQHGDIPAALEAWHSSFLPATLSCGSCAERLSIDELITTLHLNTDATHDEVVEAVRDLITTRPSHQPNPSVDTALLNLLLEHPQVPISRIAEIRGAL